MLTLPTKHNATVVQTCGSKPPVEFPEFDDAVAAGDWALYGRRCTFIASNPSIAKTDAEILKRRLAMSYLGQRAQLHGGVYLRSRPSVFTSTFIDGLAKENSKVRYLRYPWLERLMQLLEQLDQDQYASEATHGNLIKPPKPRQKMHAVSNAFA